MFSLVQIEFEHPVEIVVFCELTYRAAYKKWGIILENKVPLNLKSAKTDFCKTATLSMK